MDRLFFLLICFCLSGCIGTAFLFEDEDLTAPFPTLHSVPPRPASPDLACCERVEKKLIEEQERALMLNEQLRSQFNLETDTIEKSREEGNSILPPWRGSNP